MGVVQRKLSNTFRSFFDSEKSSGILLIVCAGISLLLANSTAGASYLGFWHEYVGGMSVEHWVNDALTAGVIGFLWLKLFGKPAASDADVDTMDFHAAEE